MYRYWPIFEVSKFERHPYTAVYLSLSLLSVVRYTQVLSHVQSHMARSSKMSQWPSREDPQMQMMAMMVANTSIVLHDDFPTFLIFFLVDFPASHFWWHRRAFIKTCFQLLASENDSANDWHIIARCFVLWTTAICRCMQRVTHGLTDLFKIKIFGIISTVCWTINLGDYGRLNCTIMGIF